MGILKMNPHVLSDIINYVEQNINKTRLGIC